MEISISYLNNELVNKTEEDKPTATWYSRWKSYKSDQMDDDMKSSTISHYVDRIIINDLQLSTKTSVNDIIEFLNNAKESFKF
jgi:hypothetical protein